MSEVNWETGNQPPSHDQATIRSLVARCFAKRSMYAPREIEFVESVRHRFMLSDAQMKWLHALADYEPVNFEKINTAALAVLDALLVRWLSDGTMQGQEYVARNPLRNDTRPGSFRINTRNGRWADFAAGDAARGGDPISLAAYLHHGGDQIAAARALAGMLGI